MITRETAKQQVRHDESSEYMHGDIVANISQVESVIDSIYDSFEQRLCNNCTFDYCGCSVQDSVLIVDPNATFDTFGCNSFESKEKPCVYVKPKNHF